MIIHTRNDDGSIQAALKIFWSKNLHFINGPNFSQQILTFYVRLDISYQVHRFVFDTLVRSASASVGGGGVVVLQKVASELHPKVRNHGEGPY